VQLAEVNPLSEAVAFDLTKAIQKFTEANAITLGVTQNVQLDRREEQMDLVFRSLADVYNQGFVHLHDVRDSCLVLRM